MAASESSPFVLKVVNPLQVNVCLTIPQHLPCPSPVPWLAWCCLIHPLLAAHLDTEVGCCTAQTLLSWIRSGWDGSWHNGNSCGRGEGRCNLIQERASGCTTYGTSPRNSTVVQVLIASLLSLVLSSSISSICKEALKCQPLVVWNKSAGPHFV